MRRIKIEVAYDGSNYCGWQIQPDKPTVEGTLDRVLSDVLKEEIKVAGASRTDAGVHALGNVAIFDTDTPIPAERIFLAVNPHLPDDIKIVKSEEVSDDFHPRFQDSLKTYEYHIQTEPAPLPVYARNCHWVPGKPDLDAMREAGQILVGRHDFKSFCAAGAQVKTTVRTIKSLELSEREISPGFNEIIITVTGEGFLYNMVRIIAGTLLKAGYHAWPPGYVEEIIRGRDRRLAGETAPAKGLILKKITYRSA